MIDAATSTKTKWWAPAAIVCAVGFAFSFVQPSCAMDRDIRLEAARSIFDAQRTYMGDPSPSIVAARRLAANPRARIYGADLSVGAAFIYPPIAARLYEPLASLPPRQQHQRLALTTHVLFWATVLLIARLVTRGRAWRWGEVAIAIGAAALFYPLQHAVELNQAMVLVTLVVGFAIASLQDGRQALAGALFALAFVIKPQLVLALPLMWWHARRLVVSAVVTSIVLLALSLAYAGVDNHVDYVTKVLPTLSRGYAYYANQSFDGLFNRLFVKTDIGVLVLPPRSAPVQVLTTVASVTTYVGAIALVRRWRASPGNEVWIFAFAWLVATLISPIAWQHHYAPALFVFALFVRTLSDEPALRTPRVVLTAAAAFTMLACYFEVRAITGAAARLVASYVFAGAILLAVAIALVLTAKRPMRIGRVDARPIERVDE